MKTEKQTLEQQFLAHLQDHEPLKLALLEAVRRFWYDNCLERFDDPKDKDFLNTVSNILSTLWHEYPDWNYRLRKYLERYSKETVPIKQVPLPYNSWALTRILTSYEIVVSDIAAKEWNYHSKWEHKSIFESKL